MPLFASEFIPPSSLVTTCLHISNGSRLIVEVMTIAPWHELWDLRRVAGRFAWPLAGRDRRSRHGDRTPGEPTRERAKTPKCSPPSVTEDGCRGAQLPHFPVGHEGRSQHFSRHPVCRRA